MHVFVPGDKPERVAQHRMRDVPWVTSLSTFESKPFAEGFHFAI
jgi:hypothetical protein